MGGNVVKGQSKLVESESENTEHSRTSMFELSSADEGSGGLRSVFGGKFVPVVLSNENGFSTKRGSSEARHLRLDLEEVRIKSSGGLSYLGRCKRSCGGEEGGDDGEFHGCVQVWRS